MCPPGVRAEADPGGALSGEDWEDSAHTEHQGVQLPGEQQVGPTKIHTHAHTCKHMHTQGQAYCYCVSLPNGSRFRTTNVHIVGVLEQNT